MWLIACFVGFGRYKGSRGHSHGHVIAPLRETANVPESGSHRDDSGEGGSTEAGTIVKTGRHMH